MTLGQRIQELRKHAGYSQEALGEELGVSRQAVSKWEGDNGIPELDTLIAMSKLFGVTLGQLLGVEEPSEKQEPSSAVDEERVEAILRRYIDESHRHEPPRRPSFWPWVVSFCCVLAIVIVTVISVGQVREVKESVNNLWSNVVDIENTMNNVRNQVGNLTDDVRDQITSALDENYQLISTFQHEVCEFDLDKETVQVRFSTTLKSYTAGSQVQFVLNWRKVDGTKGQTVTDLADGPDFITWATIPMNFHLDVSIRVLLPDGSIQEQQVDTIYSGMHPDNFIFEVFNIFGPLRLEGKKWKETYSIKDTSSVEIYGGSDLIWPVSVQVTYVLYDDGTSKTFTLISDNVEKGIWMRQPNNSDAWSVERGAYFEATLTIVDNYGRTFTYRDNGFVDTSGNWSHIFHTVLQPDGY